MKPSDGTSPGGLLAFPSIVGERAVGPSSNYGVGLRDLLQKSECLDRCEETIKDISAVDRRELFDPTADCRVGRHLRTFNAKHLEQIEAFRDGSACLRRAFLDLE